MVEVSARFRVISGGTEQGNNSDINTYHNIINNLDCKVKNHGKIGAKSGQIGRISASE